MKPSAIFELLLLAALWGGSLMILGCGLVLLGTAIAVR